VLPRLSLRHLRDRKLPIRGASAVAAIPGALLVVEDDQGIYRIEGNRATLWASPDLHRALGDLEGMAVDKAHGTVWALTEEDGIVLALPLGVTAGRATVLGRLNRPGTKKNKGFEGLAFMPARLSPTRRASLVTVHERKPRRVGVFTLPGLEQTHDLKLPDEAKEVLRDLADVTVDPVTGALLLLSDQSQCIAVTRISKGELVLTGSYELPLDEGEKPEGLDFASASRLLVVTDDSAKLLELSVTRSPARR
jgi:uncharacterized protein YjiK